MPITSRSQLDELNETLRLLYLLFISSDDSQVVVDEANKVLDGPMAPLLRRNWRERWQIESSHKRFDAETAPLRLRLYTSHFHCKLLRDDYCDVLYNVANRLVRLVEGATTPQRLSDFTKNAAKALAEYLGLVEITIPPVDVLNMDMDGYLSPRDIAKRFSVPYDALRQRLQHWRLNNRDGWIENFERSPRQAKYVYQPRSVWPIIQALLSISE